MRCAERSFRIVAACLLHTVRAVAVMLGIGMAPLHAQTFGAPSDTLLAKSLSAAILRTTDFALRWPDFSDASGMLIDVYAQQQWTPLWSRGDRPTRTALDLLAALSGIAERGLDPRDYDVTRLTALADSGLATVKRQVAFDVTMSVAAIRVLHSLRFGRVDPIDAHAHLRLPRDTIDFADDFRALVISPAPAIHLDAAEPPYVHYALLKRALSVYRERARTDTAVRSQVRKMELSLERWRWLPHEFSTTPILVNIPAFRLYALSPNSDREADMLRMDVVVGKAYGHRTPVFSDALESIVFAPYWDVPPSIAKNELIPIASRDLRWLTVNRYQILDASGRVLPPTGASLRAVSAGTARIRQLPGAGNALGLVKFVFPNAFNVYLHDTPVQSAFQRARRDLSHGCIRIANPFGLAQLLLRGMPEWDSTAIAAAMHGTLPRRVDLPRRVPVHVVYATAMAREDGTVHFYDDIYGLDATLRRQLAHGYPYRKTLR